MFDALVHALKSLIKRILPPGILPSYHKILAVLAAAWYGSPSRKMIVIGVTGTKGKTTTVHMLADILRETGAKVGFTTGVAFRVADQVWPNMLKMTMPGRFMLQRLLRQMVDAGCRYAIVETTSEGISQHRHAGISYDVVAMTNMSPEHIESHGSYEQYRAAKGKLFASLVTRGEKRIQGKDIPTVKVLNADDHERGFFEQFFSDHTWYFGMQQFSSDAHLVIAKNVTINGQGSEFDVDGHHICLPRIGRFNAMNALAAIATARALDIPWEAIIRTLAHAHLPEGRLEEVPIGKDFRVFVDYAHEPSSLTAAYEAIRLLKPQRLIAVLGSQGGGRDRAKRAELGRIAAEHADIVIVTNEDPYDESPESIIQGVAEGALASITKKVTEGENLFLITDRREAIHKALELAGPGDIVFISGKGGEKVMAIVGGRLVPWEDREVVTSYFVDKSK